MFFFLNVYWFLFFVGIIIFVFCYNIVLRMCECVRSFEGYNVFYFLVSLVFFFVSVIIDIVL